MSAAGLLKYFQFAYLSKPAHERQLYRAIRRGALDRGGAQSIVELGVGMGLRATRMIQVASRYRADETIRYTGVDLFEARPKSNPGTTLKRAHRVLTALGAKVQVVPGDPFSALSRVANSLQNTDLVVIGADQDVESLARSWFYLPRMLHADSQVFLEEHGGDTGTARFRRLDAVTIARLAKDAEPKSRRAA